MSEISKPEDFIMVYDDILSLEECHKIIEYFEYQQKNNRTHGRSPGESLRREDNSYCLGSYECTYSEETIDPVISSFHKNFWEIAYKDYSQKYAALDDIQRHKIFSFKLQKTVPGSGYHIWHSECCNRESSVRVGVYVLYLNDVHEGGETEFLYQKTRVSAKAGRLVIFPSAWTHLHRGNPPISNTKYIMTGWLEFC